MTEEYELETTMELDPLSAGYLKRMVEIYCHDEKAAELVSLTAEPTGTGWIELSFKVRGPDEAVTKLQGFADHVEQAFREVLARHQS